MEYSTANDPSFKLNIRNEKSVTRDFVLNEANEMWAKCKKAFREKKIKLGDKDKADALMRDLRKEHKEFSTSYPIILRYMAEMQTYHSKAFDKYLKKIELNPWKNESEYLDAQADYVVLLYKETHVRWNNTQISRLRINIRGILQQEHDHFKKYHDEFEKEVEWDETRLKKENVEEFVGFLRRLEGKAPTDELAAELAKVQIEGGSDVVGGSDKVTDDGVVDTKSTTPLIDSENDNIADEDVRDESEENVSIG